MTNAAPIADTVSVHVPFRIVKRGGRKEMVLPANAPSQRRTDNAIIKALARAFRWKQTLESGEFTTMAELAEREGVAPSYMTRVLRLSLLARISHHSSEISGLAGYLRAVVRGLR